MANSWQIQFYERYDRIEELFWQDLLLEKVLLADETQLQVMREELRKNTDKSWMFVFAGERIRLFQYRETRSAGFLAERLQNFKGVLATDGYRSYDTLCASLKIQHAACWVHTRRKFADILKISKGESFAKQIVAEIQKLYEIESHLRNNGDPPDARLAIRNKNSKPIVDRIFEWLRAKQTQVPESLPLGEAIRYALGQETKLRLFLENGHVPLDTNAVENAIRPFVVGRKNWMISGSPRGADSSALVYSLIGTAHACNLEPWMYCRYLFAKLPLCQNDDEIRDLLPHRVDARLIENFDPGVR